MNTLDIKDIILALAGNRRIMIEGDQFLCSLQINISISKEEDFGDMLYEEMGRCMGLIRIAF